MRYLQIDTNPSSNSDKPLPWWCGILKRLLPSANKDLDPLYKDTQIWWLEIDEQGLPQREIGFDANMKPLVLGPVGRNSGFLIDSADDWDDCPMDSPKAAANFEKIWQQLWPKFMYLEEEGKNPHHH